MNLKTFCENIVLLAGLMTAVTFSFYQDPVQDPANQPIFPSKSVQENSSMDSSASGKDPSGRDVRSKARRDRVERDAKSGNRPTRNNEPLTVEQQEEVEVFVAENNPELGKILRALREKRPQQYQRAIRSIHESYVRLQNIKNGGNEQAYSQALENWKIDSQIKMLSAQLTIKNNGAMQARLEGLVSLQTEQRLTQMKVERERLQKRLERLESSIAEFENRKESEVRRRVAAMLRSAEQARKEYQAKVRKQQTEPGRVSETNPATEESGRDNQREDNSDNFSSEGSAPSDK